MDIPTAQDNLYKALLKALNESGNPSLARESAAISTEISAYMAQSFFSAFPDLINYCIDLAHGTVPDGEGIVIPALAESVVQTLSLEILAALGVHRRVEHNP